jgi:hypothetical protein
MDHTFFIGHFVRWRHFELTAAKRRPDLINKGVIDYSRLVVSRSS